MAIVACLLSYVLGSIPNGLIWGKLIWHLDLRDYGSHNIGATNAWRTLGKRAGIFIFALDFLKGALGAGLGLWFGGTALAMVMAGLAAMLGHSFSLFLGFKGGKGVATGLGVIAMLMPFITLAVFFVWLLLVLVTGYVSLGSCVAAVLVPIFAVLSDCPAEYVLFGILAAAFINLRHKDNIHRLLNGTENKIKAGHR